MKISLIALSFALLLITTDVANGCSCSGYPTICAAYASADGVFIGSVRKVERLEPKKKEAPGEFPDTQIAHIQVEKVFKGGDISEADFRAGASSCDMVYKEGQRWLFYARYDKKSQAWRIGGCGRSASIENAPDDLLYLQALPASAQKTRLSGVLKHYENDAVKGFSLVENLSGVRVKVSDGQKTYEDYT